jgi:hypothetical protein
MAGEIRLKAAAGLANVKALIVGDDGKVRNSADTMVELSTLTDAQFTAAWIAVPEKLTSDSTGTGLYVADHPAGLTQLARYDVIFVNDVTPTPASKCIGIQHDPTEYLAGQVADIYHAAIELTIDEANSRDEYTAVWFKNGVRITSGITLPKIQVIKRADGSDLVPQTAMAAIGSTGGLKYDEASNRITSGEAVLVVVTATIDGAARTFADVPARDSSA